jgi:hypothetical protein
MTERLQTALRLALAGPWFKLPYLRYKKPEMVKIREFARFSDTFSFTNSTHLTCKNSECVVPQLHISHMRDNVQQDIWLALLPLTVT